MYGYRCEYCEGTVRSKPVKSEAFKHKNGRPGKVESKQFVDTMTLRVEARACTR